MLPNLFFLPNKAHITKLLIENIHCSKFHSGVNHVMAVLREKYWAPKARQTIKKILRNCVVCQKLQGRPFAKQPQAPLPMERVTQHRPFQVTGIDYSGALNVRNCVGTIVKVKVRYFQGSSFGISGKFIRTRIFMCVP